MAVMEVDVVQDSVLLGSTIVSKTIEAEVQNTATSLVVNNVSVPALEVVSSNFIANVVVSPTAPAIPYEGQVWIDIS
jgi:hypothetical protein